MASHITASMRSAIRYIARSPASLGKLVRDVLDDLVARVGDRVDRMAEADDDFLRRDATADVRLGLVGRVVALLDLERHLVGAAVLGSAQRADGAGDAEYMSDPVPAITRAVNVDALNSCSAYRISEVCMAATHAAGGGRPCSRCRKCPPMESSSVSTSMRLPLCEK